MSAFDENSVRRQPQGVTGGGQFATKPKGETGVTLGARQHSYTCRAHAVGCAVENLRDAGDTTSSPVSVGDGYLADGTASCRCGRDASQTEGLVDLGRSAIIAEEGHERACRAHAVGCAVENLRDAGDATSSPVSVGDGYLADGTTSCYCGLDTSWEQQVVVGEQTLREQEESSNVPSVDDFTPEQRKVIDSVHRHAYGWASGLVGNLGMETAEYAEDYAAWVARRLMLNDCDEDSLSDHPHMAREWDAERAANAAAQIATSDAEKVFVESMSNRSVLLADSFDTTASGKRARALVFRFMEKLDERGVRVSEVRTAGSVGWTITGMDGDVFGRHVGTEPRPRA